MSLLDTLDPVLIPWAKNLLDLAQRANVNPKVTSARRTYAQQAALYKRFQEGRSRFPAAPPGTSAHEWGLAFDLVVPNPQDQTDLGIVWVRWGGVYGGSYDPVHFEYPNWRSVAGISGTGDSPTPTGGNVSDTILRLADDLVLSVPTPLRGILNTAVIGNALLHFLNVNPYGYGIEWMLTHPAELTEALVAAAWSVLLGKL